MSTHFENPTLSVPTGMIEEILGYGPADQPRVLGEVTYEGLTERDEPVDGYSGVEGPTTKLTIPQFGQLVMWAFEDANDSWFEAPETTLEEVLDCRTSAADRLRGLMLYVQRHMPKNWASQPRPMAHTQWLMDLKNLTDLRPKDL